MESLAQPVRERQLGVVACRGQRRQSGSGVRRPDEDVEVLGMPADARVDAEGVGPAQQKRRAGVLEHREGATVEPLGGGVEPFRAGYDGGHDAPSCVPRQDSNPRALPRRRAKGEKQKGCQQARNLPKRSDERWESVPRWPGPFVNQGPSHE